MSEYNRREFMINMGLGGASALFLGNIGCSYSANHNRQNQSCNQQELKKLNIPYPTPAQLAWQNAEMGAVFHYDLHVFGGRRYSQGNNRRVPRNNINIFNPKQLDTDQWIKAVADMGGKFAIITAMHETGFGLWPSDVNPYCVKALKWRNGKGDVVGDFIKSCRKYGIKPGVYMETRWNSHFKVLYHKVQPGSPLTQKQYNHMLEQEVKEICTHYGELFELWFDGGVLTPQQGGPDVLPIFEKYQPNCIFYHSAQRSDVRWGGSESGQVGYPCWATMPYKGSRGHTNHNLLVHGDPNGKYWSPAMADFPLRNHDWFWMPNSEHKIYSLQSLMNIYYNSVGRNATIMMGCTPDPRGLLPEPDVKRMFEFGREIKRRFDKPLYSTCGQGNIVKITLKKPAIINHIVIQEDIAFGERVRQYKVEGFLDGGNWQLLCAGQSIGHKRIQQFANKKVNAVRLTITKAIAPPIIKNIAIYSLRV